MQMPEALGLEGMRLRGRIAVEHGGARHVALLQAHGKAVLEVDGGEQDHGRLIAGSAIGPLEISSAKGPDVHGFHFRKLAISASPSRWLFSG